MLANQLRFLNRSEPAMPSPTVRRLTGPTATVPALALLGLLFVGSPSAVAQGTTSVQLPTFNFFTVATSVSVPDGGGAYLGGVNRSSTGSNSFGAPLSPLGNRSGGSDRSAQQMSVTATIVDFREMDEEILGRASNYVMRRPVPAALSHVPSSPAGLSAATAPTESLDAIRAEVASKKHAQQRDAWECFEKGLAAEEQGKPSVAKIHYQMAYRRAVGELRQLASDRLSSLGVSPSPSTVARRPE